MEKPRNFQSPSLPAHVSTREAGVASVSVSARTSVSTVSRTARTNGSGAVARKKAERLLAYRCEHVPNITVSAGQRRPDFG